MAAQTMNKGHGSFLRESTFYVFLSIFSVTKPKSNSLNSCETVIIIVVIAIISMYHSGSSLAQGSLRIATINFIVIYHVIQIRPVKPIAS